MTTYTQGTGPFYNNGNKVNGHAAGGEHLTSALDFCTIVTSVNIAPEADGAGAESALDKLIEVVSLRGQPVIMGTPSGPDGSSNYTLKFATEHMGSWDLQPYSLAGQNVGVGAAGGANAAVNSAANLLSAIVAAGVDFGFTANNTAVTFSGF